MAGEFSKTSPLPYLSVPDDEDLSRSQKLDLARKEGEKRKSEGECPDGACTVCFFNRGNSSRKGMCYLCWQLVEPSVAIPIANRTAYKKQIENGKTLLERLQCEAEKKTPTSKEEWSSNSNLAKAFESSIRRTGSVSVGRQSVGIRTPPASDVSPARSGGLGSRGALSGSLPRISATWKCRECAHDNPLDKAQCEKCSAKPPEPQMDGESLPGTPGVWECTRCCNRETDMETEKCEKCGKWREWKCTKCTLINNYPETICLACNQGTAPTAKPEDTPKGENLEGSFLDLLSTLERQQFESEANEQKSRQQDIFDNRKRLDKRIDLLKCTEQVMVDDGNCQFRAVSFQLFRTQQFHSHIRAIVVQHMRKCASDYMAYFTSDEYEAYLKRMAKTCTWGDELTLKAAADAMGITIHVVTSDVSNWHLKYDPKRGGQRTFEIWGNPHIFLTYQAPVHYNSMLAEEDVSAQNLFLCDTADCLVVETQLHKDKLSRLQDQLGKEATLKHPLREQIEKSYVKIELCANTIRAHHKQKEEEIRRRLRALREDRVLNNNIEAPNLFEFYGSSPASSALSPRMLEKNARTYEMIKAEAQERLKREEEERERRERERERELERDSSPSSLNNTTQLNYTQKNSTPTSSKPCSRAESPSHDDTAEIDLAPISLVTAAVACSLWHLRDVRKRADGLARVASGGMGRSRVTAQQSTNFAKSAPNLKKAIDKDEGRNGTPRAPKIVNSKGPAGGCTATAGGGTQPLSARKTASNTTAPTSARDRAGSTMAGAKRTTPSTTNTPRRDASPSRKQPASGNGTPRTAGSPLTPRVGTPRTTPLSARKPPTNSGFSSPRATGTPRAGANSPRSPSRRGTPHQDPLHPRQAWDDTTNSSSTLPRDETVCIDLPSSANDLQIRLGSMKHRPIVRMKESVMGWLKSEEGKGENRVLKAEEEEEADEMYLYLTTTKNEWQIALQNIRTGKFLRANDANHPVFSDKKMGPQETLAYEKGVLRSKKTPLTWPSQPSEDLSACVPGEPSSWILEQVRPDGMALCRHCGCYYYEKRAGETCRKNPTGKHGSWAVS